MTVAHIYTVAFQGIEAREVDVQVHIGASGEGQFTVVGLGDKAVTESRERVRAALSAIGLAMPYKRVTVNLAPADLPKEGSHYDLPIALGLLAAMGVLPASEMANYVALGELSLDASVIVRNIRNEVVRTFWRKEFEHYHYRQKADAVAPIQNKIGALLADPTLYRILVAPQEDLKFRSMMDRGEVLLANLSKGQLGEDSSHLLGGLIVSTLGLAAFSRAEVATVDRLPFAIFIDEFQSFTTLMLANMTAELRKNAVSLVLANQHLNQLDPDIRHSVLGNAGTLISFRVGPEDAALLAKEFQPYFGVQDLLSLPNYHIYLKLMIEGTPSKAFSARTLIC